MAKHRTPPLSVEEIVDAAMRLAADGGLEALGMRQLSAALDVAPAAVYHHVGSKEALVALVLDAVVSGVAVPADDLAWDDWLAAYSDALWNRLHAYRGLARHLLEHPSTPAGAAIRRATVDMLTAHGFNARDALLVAATFHTYLLGQLAVEALPEEVAGPLDPVWRSHGLSAHDYAEHGRDVVLRGLCAKYG